METMENEFIFTEVFAVVWLILSVAMLATAIYLRSKQCRTSTTKWEKTLATWQLIRFLWLLYSVAMIVAFGTEMTIKMM